MNRIPSQTLSPAFLVLHRGVLPAGVYVVRVAGSEIAAMQQITVVR